MNRQPMMHIFVCLALLMSSAGCLLEEGGEGLDPPLSEMNPIENPTNPPSKAQQDPILSPAIPGCSQIKAKDFITESGDGATDNAAMAAFCKAQNCGYETGSVTCR